MIESLKYPSEAVQQFLQYLGRNAHRRVADFGKHAGKQYAEIVAEDPYYCEWAHRKAKNGPLLHFVSYLREHAPLTKPCARAEEVQPRGKAWREGPFEDLPLTLDALDSEDRPFGDLKPVGNCRVNLDALDELLGAPGGDTVFAYGGYVGRCFRDVAQQQPPLCTKLLINSDNVNVLGQLKSFCRFLHSVSYVPNAVTIED